MFVSINIDALQLLFHIFEMNPVFVVENMCDSSPCQYGGTCDEDNQTCKCSEGYSGDFCQIICEFPLMF